MSTLELQLLEIPGNYNAQKGFLDTARAYIAIKGSSIEKVDEVEFTTISAECRTSKEIEGAADWLIEQLKTIKKQAATFFKKEKENRQRMADKS
jgi:hypothetical protein